MASTFDFIIVGGDTAGCLLAKRLASTKKKPSVLLVEAGGDGLDTTHRMPANRFLNAFTKPDWDYNYVLTPNPVLDGKALPYARGKGLGGSSLINFMVYTRGATADYDRWAELVGSEEWTWQKSEERFKRIESISTDELSPEVKKYVNIEPGSMGTDGPVQISLSSTLDAGLKISLESAAELDIPLNLNLNSGNPMGVGLDFLATKAGLRTTSASAHIHSEKPDNLIIWTNAQVAKIVLEDKKAVGIETTDGRKASSTTEVILCAGAINSPQVLLLSGIGPAAELATLNIEVKHDLSGVGENLQDHCGSPIFHHLGHGVSDRVAFMFNPEKVKAAEDQWLRDHTGEMATAQHETALSFHKDPAVTNSKEFKALDSSIQAWINEPTVPNYEIILNAGIQPPGYTFDDKEDAFLNIFVIMMHPLSRGSVKLQSANPADPPLVDMAFMQHPFDRLNLISAVRKAMQFMETKTYAKFWKHLIFGPKSSSDEDVWEFIKLSLSPIWHANGSVMMGKKGDKMACVDSELRVYGIESLRVADLSVCPLTPSNHSQATAYLVGEFAAEKIIQEHNLD
ncbi:hypothetical protein B7463_g5582, partial [Scytalidium lignicola]